jgi:hypothetical protein
VDDLQHRRALDRYFHSHHDLPVGCGPHGRWDELVAGSTNHLPGQHPRSHPDPLERPRRHQVRRSVPGLRPCLLRGEGGQLRGHRQGPRGLRLVRYPDLARRSRPRCSRNCCMGWLGQHTRTHLHSLRRFLGCTARHHPDRHRGSEVVRVVLRAAPDRRRRCAPDLGVRRGWRRGQRILDFCRTPAGQRTVLDALLAQPRGERGLLDHPLTFRTLPATRRLSARRSSGRPSASRSL